MTLCADAKGALRLQADPAKAAILKGFFKTGPGQYGEGDRFLGVTVPQIRRIAAKCRNAGRTDLEKLLRSRIHEERLLAVLILLFQFSNAGKGKQRCLYSFYLSHTDFINNWDLVDVSAPAIVGAYLENRPKVPLIRLARSPRLWERRIAILATFHFIRRGRPEETFRIAKILLSDRHDLIHKAVGWMLREVGKRCSENTEEVFLKKHYRAMPRTMLRYAIERFPEQKRRKYLTGNV